MSKKQQDLEEINKYNLLLAQNLLLPVILYALGCRLILVCFCPKRPQLGPLQSGEQSFIFFVCLVFCSRSEEPHVESENGPSAHEDVYGPQPQAPEKKLLSEETMPTLTGPHRRLGKLPAATHILNSILNNYNHKLRPSIGGE